MNGHGRGNFEADRQGQTDRKDRRQAGDVGHGTFGRQANCAWLWHVLCGIFVVVFCLRDMAWHGMACMGMGAWRVCGARRAHAPARCGTFSLSVLPSGLTLPAHYPQWLAFPPLLPLSTSTKHSDPPSQTSIVFLSLCVISACFCATFLFYIRSFAAVCVVHFADMLPFCLSPPSLFATLFCPCCLLHILLCLLPVSSLPSLPAWFP